MMDTGRFDDERNTYSRADRDEAEMKLAVCDEVRTMLRKAGRDAVERLAEIGMLNKTNAILGSSVEEIAVGIEDELTGTYDLILSARAFREASDLAEGCEDVARDY